jgi:hypothetical protein
MLRRGDNFPTFHVRAGVGLEHAQASRDAALARPRTVGPFGKLNREFADRTAPVLAAVRTGVARSPSARRVALAKVERVVPRSTFIVDPRGASAA